MSLQFDLHSAALSDLHLPCPCHAPTMPFFSRSQHSTAVCRRPCCGLEKNGMFGAWYGHGKASVNQIRLHCVNQMVKTHFKPLTARHDSGKAWARHAMWESAFTQPQYRSRFRYEGDLSNRMFPIPNRHPSAPYSS